MGVSTHWKRVVSCDQRNGIVTALTIIYFNRNRFITLGFQPWGFCCFRAVGWKSADLGVDLFRSRTLAPDLIILGFGAKYAFNIRFGQHSACKCTTYVCNYICNVEYAYKYIYINLTYSYICRLDIQMHEACKYLQASIRALFINFVMCIYMHRHSQNYYMFLQFAYTWSCKILHICHFKKVSAHRLMQVTFFVVKWCSIQQTQVAIETDGNSRGDKATARPFFDFGNPTNAMDMLRSRKGWFEGTVCFLDSIVLCNNYT
jgi:hypothetical protein